MLEYYFFLGIRSLRRNPALTILMVLTLAVGVAASVSTLTILQVMSGNPIPHKSDRLLVPLLDVAMKRNYVPGVKEPYSQQSTYRDSVSYLRSGPGVRRCEREGWPGPSSGTKGKAVEEARKQWLHIGLLVGRGEHGHHIGLPVFHENVVQALVYLGRGAGEAVVVHVGQFLAVRGPAVHHHGVAR